MITPQVEHVDGDTAVVTVVGHTNLWSGEEVAETLGTLKREGRRRIVVDAGAAAWLNSKVLDVLVRCADDLDPRAGEGLVLVTRHDYVKQILQVGATGGSASSASSRESARNTRPPVAPTCRICLT